MREREKGERKRENEERNREIKGEGDKKGEILLWHVTDIQYNKALISYYHKI